MKNVCVSGTKHRPGGGPLLCVLAPECCVIIASGEQFQYQHLENVFNECSQKKASPVSVNLSLWLRDQILVELKNVLEGMSSKAGLFKAGLEKGWALGYLQRVSFCRFLVLGKRAYWGYYWGNFMNHRIHVLFQRLSWGTSTQTKNNIWKQLEN